MGHIELITLRVPPNYLDSLRSVGDLEVISMFVQVRGGLAYGFTREFLLALENI